MIGLVGHYVYHTWRTLCSSILADRDICNWWYLRHSTAITQWYHAMYQTITWSAAFYTELKDLLDEVNGLPGCSTICGDSNNPSSAVSWMLDQQLMDIITMNDCRQHVSEPTHRYGDLLDYWDWIIYNPIHSYSQWFWCVWILWCSHDLIWAGVIHLPFSSGIVISKVSKSVFLQ